MSSLDKKREDFRKYLDSAGAIDNLTKALIKLYEQPNKPSDAVKFIRKHMCESCPDDEQFEIMAADLTQANKKICEMERELARFKGSVKRSASEINLAMTKGFDDLNSAGNVDGMLKKFLTKDIIENLKDLKTRFKGTFLDCIQSGLEIINSSIGVYACDEEAYTLFATLFDPLIEELHGFNRDDKQPALDWGESCKLPELDPNGDSVISIRISCSRSVESFPFAAIMSMEQYEQIMNKVQNRTKCLCGDLKGKFHPLEGIDPDFKKKLIDENLMFKENDPLLKAANGARFWPTGRGIFINEAKTFVIWCNEEDHLRFISMEQGSNLRDAYDRLIIGVTQISKDISMAHDKRLGFLTFSPENLGNTIRLSIRLKLEKLSQKKEKFDELAEKFDLKVSKLSECDESCYVYDISSKKRLGLTEFETVNGFAEAIVALINADKDL